jgi:predicted metal-dependent hydrolase
VRYEVVRGHLAAFLATVAARTDGAGLPAFVTKEVRKFLGCGLLEHRFDRLIQTESLEFHLAYAADIEATYTPLFNVWLRHRASFFDNGDPRVAPLFLWHLVEEIEHRRTNGRRPDHGRTRPSIRRRRVGSVR